MAEPRSSLASLPASSPVDAAVTLTEFRPGSILMVAAWPGSSEQVATVIRELVGVKAPSIGSAVADPNLTVAAIAPGRFMIAGRAPDLAPRFEAALTSEDGAATNLAQGRVILRLQGAAADLLQRCVALDLEDAAFPTGRVAQTMIHHIDVMIHRLGRNTFDVWVLRGFAHALAEWLIDVGADLGVGCGPGAE